MNKQSGMSFIGVVLTVVGIAFVAMLGMKLIPVYLTDKKVQDALNTAADEARISTLSKREFLQKMATKLDIDFAGDAINLREDVFFERTDTGTLVTVEYEKVVPLVYNISALMEFQSAVEIQN